MRRGIALLVACAIAAAQARAADDPVELLPIASATFVGDLFNPWLPAREAGSPASIHGVLRLPSGDGRVPAVVVLHGCSGIGAAETAWARHLRELGYATLIVNSFSGRGIASVCRGTQRLPAASALSDALAALEAMAGHPRVDAARIAVLGESLGALAAVASAHARLRERYAAGPHRFAAHVAIHSAGCVIRLADAPDRDGGPILLLHGTDDDWIPVAACREQVEGWRRDGVDAELRTYAGARHAFDHEGLAHGTAVGIVNIGGCRFVESAGRLVDDAGQQAGDRAPCVRRRGTVAHDPVAARQALADVTAFLDRTLRRR